MHEMSLPGSPEILETDNLQLIIELLISLQFASVNILGEFGRTVSKNQDTVTFQYSSLDQKQSFHTFENLVI